MKPHLVALGEGRGLDSEALDAAFGLVLDGEASPAQIAAFLMGLKIAGEGAREMAAAARGLRARMIRVDVPFPTIDVCGTGGDGARTRNISTAVAFVLAGAGLKVAKHGNRAMSSRSGAADVLEALGLDLGVAPDVQAHALAEAGAAFLFAQAHHGGMRHASPVRREIGVRTVFNLAGPLSNPAGAQRQLVGVYAPELVGPMAQALQLLGAEAAWVVHGAGGLDELSLAGTSTVAVLDARGISIRTVNPADAGLPEAPVEALAGGSPQENAAALRALLEAERGPYRDAVVLNAAAALVLAERAGDLAEGAQRAQASIDSGAAKAALDALLAIAGRP